MPDIKKYEIMEDDLLAIRFLIDKVDEPKVMDYVFFEGEDDRLSYDYLIDSQNAINTQKRLYDAINNIFSEGLPDIFKFRMRRLEESIQGDMKKRGALIERHENFTEEQKLDYAAGVITYSGKRYTWDHDGSPVYRVGTELKN